MRYAIVAVAQQAMRLYTEVDTYRENVERFFRLAEGKRARLLVFPELSALMVVPPLVEGFRAGLLKKADQARSRYTSWWTRTRSGIMRSTAKLLRADIRQDLLRALDTYPDLIWQTYVEVFAGLAYEYKMTVVAGSGYFPDPNDGTMRNLATVFGPDGQILGQQAKVLLSSEEENIAQPGSGWQAIETPLGRLGIVFSDEGLFPEVGRLLAFQGVEMIVSLAATTSEEKAIVAREGLRARVEDNQIFGAISFIVGPNPFAVEESPDYVGRSALFAPTALTPRRNGVLVEAGSISAEILVTARWDFEVLHDYWRTAVVPVRRRLPVGVLGNVLATIYTSGVTLEDATRALPAAGPRALPELEEAPTPVSAPPTAEEMPAAAAEVAEEPIEEAETEEEERERPVAVEEPPAARPVPPAEAPDEGPPLEPRPEEEPPALEPHPGPAVSPEPLAAEEAQPEPEAPSPATEERPTVGEPQPAAGEPTVPAAETPTTEEETKAGEETVFPPPEKTATGEESSVAPEDATTSASGEPGNGNEHPTPKTSPASPAVHTDSQEEEGTRPPYLPSETPPEQLAPPQGWFQRLWDKLTR